MTSFAEAQEAFASAVLDADAALPAQVTRKGGGAPTRRFAVYRNNVYAGLIDVLAGRFPVVARLVGEDFFRAALESEAADLESELDEMTFGGDAGRSSGRPLKLGKKQQARADATAAEVAYDRAALRDALADEAGCAMTPDGRRVLVPVEEVDDPTLLRGERV